MLINCFRSAGGKSLNIDDDRPEACRVVPNFSTKKHHTFRRQGSDGSQLSTSSSKSNESISKLPPCNRSSDAKVESMLMPVPYDARPSKCLRLSHPRIYSSLVSDMKSSKGCRDWRNFPTFYNDDVDMSMTADEAARKRAIDYQRKLRQLNYSFESGECKAASIEVDMIG